VAADPVPSEDPGVADVVTETERPLSGAHPFNVLTNDAGHVEGSVQSGQGFDDALLVDGGLPSNELEVLGVPTLHSANAGQYNDAEILGEDPASRIRTEANFDITGFPGMDLYAEPDDGLHP